MNPTSIEISIQTPYKHETPTQKARQQIESVSHLISVLFWTLRKNAEAFDELDLRNDYELFDFGDFREKVQLLAFIGEGLSSQLTLYVLQTEVKDEQ
jgi:hypothetical protein